MKGTDENLKNTRSGRVWSNQDLDPVAPERRNWSAWTFAGYWISESWAPNTWSVGSSMVAGGLLWWHALLACIVGHFIAALLTVWNGRGGAVYHIGFPIWMRATFGMWGSLLPLACRSVLALVWCGIQTWFGALFIDVSFCAMFGKSWINIPNKLPLSADITTRFMTAYLLSYLASLTCAFFRPHQMKPLIKLKAITMPFACIGLFIWAMVRSGGPGTLELSNAPKSKSLLGWSFVAAVNAAINGEFGPLIASDSDISRYARKPKDQLIGQLSVAPWSASVVVCFGIIAAACTQKIYGEAFWNPGEIMYAILAENDSSATRFAVFLCAFIFAIGCVGTNYVANLLPFGVDASGFAPKYLNITRSQILCATIGAWVVVPWKVLTSGANFLTAITGMGIFVACMLGIMVSDYYFVRKGNYWVEDLYNDHSNGRYWYSKGFHWRAYAAYICGIAIPFPGFVGAISGNKMASLLNPAGQIYAIGYLLAFAVGGVTYYGFCKISPPPFVDEARALPFESIGRSEVLMGIHRVGSDDIETVAEEQIVETKKQY
ncbi:hypothetical protein K505DRAFT_240319 [Melanomma pulvis-pyrius CBS 109.77]|uniref:Uracil permease n=1 Tax=Melanomma pulvis-pyrius CBS 109.77 TaxID=1314802 RepID=A0A6A6XFM7_9PLEO|nr:hypothetical protein K505DRAFT_240319 [Melanomma pulvis-pyrius CBS 109.77]